MARGVCTLWFASRGGALSGQKDGFVDVNTEISDDSDDEDGGPDQEECVGGGGSGCNSANHMTFFSDGLPVSLKLYTNNEQGTTPEGGRGGRGA